MINRLDESITNQYQNLSNTVNNYDRGQQESIGNLVDALEKKLQQVFQFVSNGKRKVASALLTKGVSIEKDATFDEICNGILSVPQELVIGVQEIPGIVTYEKHYHVDKSGVRRIRKGQQQREDVILFRCTIPIRVTAEVAADATVYLLSITMWTAAIRLQKRYGG